MNVPKLSQRDQYAVDMFREIFVVNVSDSDLLECAAGKKPGVSPVLRAPLAEVAKAELSRRGRRSTQTVHLPGALGLVLCGESSEDNLLDDVREATCFYCRQLWDKANGGI
jgi:hypothetical protein